MVKGAKRWMKKAALLFTILKLTSILVILFMPSGTPAITDEQGQELPASIAVLEKVEIGGIKQWVLIRGEDIKNPILLYLHGGPGNPEMPLAFLTGSELEKSFTVVHWDQRGAGKTFSPFTPKEAMTVSQFVDDTKEVTEYLQKRIGQNEVYLLGHSWGALIGLKTVAAYPELYQGYIGMGQFTDAVVSEQYAYTFVMEEAYRKGDTRTMMALSSIGQPPYEHIRDLAILKNKVTHYGGAFYGESSWLNTITRNIIRAREYAPLDYLRFIAGSHFSGILMEEVMQIDMFEEVAEVTVPVYFLSGQYDYMTSFPRVEEYYHFLEAPHKEHILFTSSAHNPIYEEPHRFVQEMVRIRDSGHH